MLWSGQGRFFRQILLQIEVNMFFRMKPIHHYKRNKRKFRKKIMRVSHGTVNTLWSVLGPFVMVAIMGAKCSSSDADEATNHTQVNETSVEAKGPSGAQGESQAADGNRGKTAIKEEANIHRKIRPVLDLRKTKRSR